MNRRISQRRLGIPPLPKPQTRWTKATISRFCGNPFYRRVLAFRALIRDGSQHHAIITSSYRDWSPAYQKDCRPDSMIRRARLTMGRARFRQMWEGVWEHGTEDWYDAKDLSACCTLKSPVLARRVAENSVFGFGWDTAGSTNTKADFNAGVVWGEDRFRISDEGPIEAIHRIAQGMFASGSVLWPQVVDDRPAADLAACDPEQRQALAALSLCLSQFLSIKVVVGADLAPRITKRGFLTFTAEGKKKKDLAYAALYGLSALLSLLMAPDFHEENESASHCMAMG